jgi:hypothetical protein
MALEATNTITTSDEYRDRCRHALPCPGKLQQHTFETNHSAGVRGVTVVPLYRQRARALCVIRSQMCRPRAEVSRLFAVGEKKPLTNARSKAPRCPYSLHNLVRIAKVATDAFVLTCHRRFVDPNSRGRQFKLDTEMSTGHTRNTASFAPWWVFKIPHR